MSSIAFHQFVSNFGVTFFQLSVFLHLSDTCAVQTVPIRHVFPGAAQDHQLQQQLMKVYIRS